MNGFKVVGGESKGNQRVSAVTAKRRPRRPVSLVTGGNGFIGLRRLEHLNGKAESIAKTASLDWPTMRIANRSATCLEAQPKP